MSVSSVLEGYLSVYGWQVYGSIFLLLVAVGAVLYPIARIVFDAAIAFAESGGGPDLGARSLILRLAIYFVVLVLGLIPLAPLDVGGLNVQNRCGREALTALGQKYESLQGGEYGFSKIKEARVPLLPYLAMVLASGFNAVLNKATPCLHDITNLNLAMNALDFSQAEDPNSLYAQVARFEDECGRRAQNIVNNFLSESAAPEARKFMADLLEKYAAGDQRLRHIQVVYFGSKFYQDNFYKPCAARGDPNTPAGQLCQIAPLRAQNPVEGFAYDAARDSDLSRYQAARGLGFPTCDQWWNDASHGVRAQILKAGGAALDAQYKKLLMGRICRPDMGESRVVCLGSKAVSEDIVVEQMMLAPKRQLGIQSPELGWGQGLAAAGLFLFSNVAQSVASQAAGYWVTIYLMKIGTALLQPFVLMALYMLWGLFLVIGEMRGMTLVKGMMLVFVLGILPSLWQFADFIDDQIFLLLYPGAPPITNPLQIPDKLLGDPSTVERLLLMLVAGVFYVFLPLLMLYLIAEAGGPAAGGRMASEGINSPARGLANIGGGPVGGASFSNSLATKAYGRWKGKTN